MPEHDQLSSELWRSCDTVLALRVGYLLIDAVCPCLGLYPDIDAEFSWYICAQFSAQFS